MFISIVSSMSKQNKRTKKNKDKQYGTLTSVPDGMTTRLGPGDKPYLVPQYLVPAMDQAFASFHQKGYVGVLEAKPQVSHGATGTDGPAGTRHCRICGAVPVSQTLYFFIVSLAYLFYDS